MNGNIKSYRKYDENSQANGSWIFYDEIGEREKISEYFHGKLIREKIKEIETTKIGFVEYFYYENGDIVKEYIPQRNEFLRIIKEKEGYQDVYCENERRRIVQYRRYDEKDNLVIVGEFDEELK